MAPLRSGHCIEAPHLCGFPDQTNTGVPLGTHLQLWAGGTISTPGEVISDRDITGEVVINATGVVIKRSRIRSKTFYGVIVRAGSVRVEDSEFSDSTWGIAGDNWQVVRCNFHDFGDDAAILGSNTTLTDSYIHDFATAPGNHGDGAQMQGGERHITVRHNTIMATSHTAVGSNSALFLAPDLGPSSPGPVDISDNLLGGGAYTVYVVDGGDGRYVVDNITLARNRFVRNSSLYGPLRVNVPARIEANVWDDDGTSVSG